MPTKTATVAKLDKRELKVLRQKLVVKQQELLTAFQKNREAGNETSGEGIQDLADKAVSAYTKEFMYSLSDGERQVLLMIDEALVHLNNGTFGVCSNCSARVESKRLEVVPWTRHCIRCQELHEKGMLN